MILKYLDGFGPGTDRPNLITTEPQKHDPPKGLIKRLDGFGVETYREKNARGDIFEVVCFACDTLWLKSWTSVDLGDSQRIVPKLCGSFLLRHPVLDYLFCPCEASRFATRNRPERRFAGTVEVAEAIAYELKLKPLDVRTSVDDFLEPIL